MVRSSNQLVSGNQLSSSLAPMKAIGTKKKLLKGKDYVLHMIFFLVAYCRENPFTSFNSMSIQKTKENKVRVRIFSAGEGFKPRTSG